MSTPGMAPLPATYFPDFKNLSDPKQAQEMLKQLQDNMDALGLTIGQLRRQAVGSTTLTIPNLSLSAAVTVSHAFGTVPTAVFAQAVTPPFGGYAGTGLTVYNRTTTTFDLYGFNFNGYSSGVVVNVHYLLTT
jgi:hypothetical protein